MQQFDNSAAAKDASELIGHWFRVQDIDLNASGAEGAAQDAMLIYTYAKAMDPASAVREREYDTVQAWATNRKDALILNALRMSQVSPLLRADARQAIRERIGLAANAAAQRYNNELPKLNADLDRIYGPFPTETWREPVQPPYQTSGRPAPQPSIPAPAPPPSAAPNPFRR